MKVINATELRTQDKPTLKTTLTNLIKKQFQLKMQHGTGQLGGTHQLKQVQREIARVKTVLTEQESRGGQHE